MKSIKKNKKIIPIKVKAVIAIKKYPLINGSFNVQELLLSSAVNLAIAVDLNFNGLIVPVIKNAEKNNLLKYSPEWAAGLN